MRIFFCSFFNFFICIQCSDQTPDTYQPAKIYRQAGIKSRALMYNYSHYQTRAVDFFDRNGIINQHIDFDTVNGQYFRKTILQYDSSQIPVNGITYMYSRYDKSAKKSVHLTVPDTLRLKFEYDSLSRVMRRTDVTASGEIIFESLYSPQMLRRKEKYIGADSGRLEIFIEYEVAGIEKKVVVTNYSPGGKSEICTYIYKNTFDKSGRIKRRTMERECNCIGGENTIPYFREYSFQYMSNGLLINRTGSDRSDDDDRWILGQLFDYKFW